MYRYHAYLGSHSIDWNVSDLLKAKPEAVKDLIELGPGALCEIWKDGELNPVCIYKNDAGIIRRLSPEKWLDMLNLQYAQ